MGVRRPLLQRFEEKVVRSPEPDGCWEFRSGASTASGHRQIWNRGSMRLAHRVAWELDSGHAVPEGLGVLHRCDNPPCVRPSHLFLGTVADNNADRDRKGRHVALRGEDHGSTRLTDAQVEAIRALCSADVPQHLISKAVGVSQAYVSVLVRGESRTPG